MIQMHRNYPVTIAETPSFQRQAKNYLSEAELAEVIGHIAFCPEEGAVISGSGGVRKIRWERSGMGKRGGLRIIYFFHDLNMPIYLLAVYPKSRKDNISAEEKKIMQQLTRELVRAHVGRRIVSVKEVK